MRFNNGIHTSKGGNIPPPNSNMLAKLVPETTLHFGPELQGPSLTVPGKGKHHTDERRLLG